MDREKLKKDIGFAIWGELGGDRHHCYRAAEVALAVAEAEIRKDEREACVSEIRALANAFRDRHPLDSTAEQMAASMIEMGDHLERARLT